MEVSNYPNEKNLKTIVDSYFAAWNDHDLASLKELFHKKIQLKDWNIHESGIESVLKANANIFKDVPLIKVEVLDLALAQTKIMAEIKVLINKEESLDVIDVFEIEGNLIKSIKAFKC